MKLKIDLIFNRYVTNLSGCAFVPKRTISDHPVFQLLWHAKYRMPSELLAEGHAACST